MVRAQDCLKKYGQPGSKSEGQWMMVWDVPADLEAAFAHVKFFPQRLYCNRAMVGPLEKALRLLIARGLAQELVEWGGCYNYRAQRGGSALSLHSWGIAVDVNPKTNALGKALTLSPAFVACFKEVGFDWGGEWQRKDGMHMQLATI